MITHILFGPTSVWIYMFIIHLRYMFFLLFLPTAVLPSGTGKKCTLLRAKNVHLTKFTMGKIFIIVSIFSDICYFFQYYMKNKIGILKNDKYIFPIVNSVIC